MLKTVRRAFQIEDIRRRILYTFAMLIGEAWIQNCRLQGVDPTFIQEFFQQHTGDAFNFFEAFTGGSLPIFRICPEHHAVHHLPSSCSSLRSQFRS